MISFGCMYRFYLRKSSSSMWGPQRGTRTRPHMGAFQHLGAMADDDGGDPYFSMIFLEKFAWREIIFRSPGQYYRLRALSSSP